MAISSGTAFALSTGSTVGEPCFVSGKRLPFFLNINLVFSKKNMKLLFEEYIFHRPRPLKDHVLF